MSYVRLFKLCQDFALGYQTFNQASQNNTAIFDQFNLRHGELLGAHEDPLIPIAAADFMIVARVENGTSTDILEASKRGARLGIPTRLGTGYWRIPVAVSYTAGVPVGFVGAIATVKCSTDTAVYATCGTGVDDDGICIYIKTWTLNGTPAGADYGFSLFVWMQA